MPELPKKLQSKYRLVNWPGRGVRQVFGPKFRVVDLRIIDAAKCERLIQMGFPYIERIETTEAAAAASKKNK